MSITTIFESLDAPHRHIAETAIHNLVEIRLLTLFQEELDDQATNAARELPFTRESAVDELRLRMVRNEALSALVKELRALSPTE